MHEFAAVDRADDPAMFVRYLDELQQAGDLQRLKRQTYALLEPSPGHRILDVGCGTGEDVRELGALVGPEGLVTGVDTSRHLIEVATERSRTSNLPGTFLVADAQSLPFSDATFDSCRAERVLQHLTDPGQAVAEMIRVVRPGGKLVCFEPDWDLQIFDAPDRALTLTIRAFRANRLRSGGVGRQLRGHFIGGGLVDVQMTPIAGAITELAMADVAMDIRGSLAEAVDCEIVTAVEASRWWSDLEATDRAGRFLAVSVAFLLVGRKPTEAMAAFADAEEK